MSFQGAMSPGRNQGINNHLLLSAIAAALRKEGDVHCQKLLEMLSQADDLGHCYQKYNARKFIFGASCRARTVH